MTLLRLTVASYTDHNHWRWVLTNERGEFQADHSVALDPSHRFRDALDDLPRWLELHAAPDRRDAEERRLLNELGAWMGDALLGPTIAAKLRGAGPAAIILRVTVPAEAAALLIMPLELAHVGGMPLAEARIRPVFQVDGEGVGWHAQPVGQRLRILALFSLPPTGSPLNLRRERQALRTLAKQVSVAAGKALELRVLQYGVTRDSLRQALEEGEGWDIIHFSGHGLPGTLALETPDGQHDLIEGAELREMLAATGNQLKLLVLSACLSAAGTLTQTATSLGLPNWQPRRDNLATHAGTMTQAPSLARDLAASFDCAVLAMRYAVEDEFAITMASSLYDALLRQRQPLPRAVQTALGKALPGAGALSLTIPALFGKSAAALTLIPPPASGEPLVDTKLAGFPAESPHFVGRVAAMTAASAALAPDRMDSAGVMFLGMAGAGKTTMAVELVYHHAPLPRFRTYLFFEAPKEGADISGVLTQLAIGLESRLLGLKMIDKISGADSLTRFLPTLTEALEQSALLLVMDNLETLLTPEGQWRDTNFGLVVAAMLAARGLSRVVMTSRIRPATLDRGIVEIPVHALPLDEAMLLLREMPNLGPMIQKGTGAERDLVRRTLRLVQGHPKLIELADAQAADTTGLSAQLDRAEVAAAGSPLDRFFQNGDSNLPPDHFTQTLTDWTNNIAATLPAAACTLFQVLCCIEEEDRELWVVAANWSDIWHRLGHTDAAPDLTATLAPLQQAALLDQTEDGTIRLHPGVALAGRAAAGAAMQAAVDRELVAFWVTLFQRGMNKIGQNPSAGPMIQRAGMSAFAYLSRLGKWDMASTMIEHVAHIDGSPATIAALLPRMQRVVEATTRQERGLVDRQVLARLLSEAGQGAMAETEMQDILAAAEAQDNFRLASAVAGQLRHLMLRTSRYQNALAMADIALACSIKAGDGSWTRLGDQGARLQIMAEMGNHQQVLDQVAILRQQMAGLGEKPENDESVVPYNVRETLLDTGHTAALALGEWELALDLNNAIRDSQRSRSAPPLQLAGTDFNDYGPMLRLGRLEAASSLLTHCRKAFQAAGDVAGIGKVLSAQADLQDKRRHPDTAVQLERTALRYKYSADDPRDMAISHNNLANYLGRAGGGMAEILAHRLAALAITSLSQSDLAKGHQSNLAYTLHHAGTAGRMALPPDFASLCQIVELVEGVRFGALFAQLAAGRMTGDEWLTEAIEAVEKILSQAPPTDA